MKKDLEQRWFSREELTGKVAFYCRDYMYLDRLATDWVKGQWYWTRDEINFFGPYRKQKHADVALKRADDEANDGYNGRLPW